MPERSGVDARRTRQTGKELTWRKRRAVRSSISKGLEIILTVEASNTHDRPPSLWCSQ